MSPAPASAQAPIPTRVVVTLADLAGHEVGREPLWQSHYTFGCMATIMISIMSHPIMATLVAGERQPRGRNGCTNNEDTYEDNYRSMGCKTAHLSRLPFIAVTIEMIQGWR
jgi:hypothetical protein